MMEWRSASKIAALVIALPTTAVLLYWLLLRKDYDDIEDDQVSGETSTKSRQTVIQVAVPSKLVGALIGPKGANIKKIQEETGARVNFSDQMKEREGDEARTVVIRGDSQSAQKAEILIRQTIADMPIVITEEVLVPVYCLGRLIGRGGETIRSMSRASHCKIFIDRSQDAQGAEVPRVVAITGTEKDIKLAKRMIREKVLEEEEFRSKAALTGAHREQRKGVKKGAEQQAKGREPLVSRVVESSEGSWDSGDQQWAGIPGAVEVKEFMQVFVSAVEHADHFWLQMVSQTALRLDTMTDDMSLFYSNDQATEKYRLTEVRVGDVVAAPFSGDKMWYRARVEGMEDGKVDLYYFDFGDNGLLPLEDLRELKPEYLSLPVQAIECKLANVKPIGDQWSEESADVLEDLTHCAEWKILSARTVSYLPLPSGNRPCVQLVDTDTDPPTDVAKELVARGLAVWEEPLEQPPSPSSPASLDSSAADGTVRAELVPDPSPS